VPLGEPQTPETDILYGDDIATGQRDEAERRRPGLTVFADGPRPDGRSHWTLSCLAERPTLCWRQKRCVWAAARRLVVQKCAALARALETAARRRTAPPPPEKPTIWVGPSLRRRILTLVGWDGSSN